MNTELEIIKLHLNISDSSQDDLLTELLDTCMDEAKEYTRQSDETKLYTVVRLMVEECYSRLGAEGLSSANYSGITEGYFNGYSDRVVKMLNRHRKVKVV